MSLPALLTKISACELCAKHLPLGPRPIIAASVQASVLIIGQAPGAKVHETGIPWNDASGRLLRDWLGVKDDVFYDKKKIALVPMGFCYPGKGKSGDMPPRPECAPQWHHVLLKQMKHIQLTILIGQYAQQYYLRSKAGDTLTDTVRNFKKYGPLFIPLPHPSPRNRIWLKRNPWFQTELLPELKKKITKILG